MTNIYISGYRTRQRQPPLVSGDAARWQLNFARSGHGPDARSAAASPSLLWCRPLRCSVRLETFEVDEGQPAMASSYRPHAAAGRSVSGGVGDAGSERSEQ